jgi:hypothetical protein
MTLARTQIDLYGKQSPLENDSRCGYCERVGIDSGPRSARL